MAIGKKSRRRGARKGNKLATVKTVKRMIKGQSETKYVDNQQIPVGTIDGDGEVVQLNVIEQGTDIGQRVGNQIRMQRLDFRLQILNSQAISNRVRLILFYYRMETVSDPGPEDILDSKASARPAEANMVSALYWRNNGKFKILYDKVHTVCSTLNNPAVLGDQPTGGGVPYKHIHIVKNLKNKLAQYVDGTNTTPVTKGWIGFLIISDSDPLDPQANMPRFNYQSVLWYKDS